MYLINHCKPDAYFNQTACCSFHNYQLIFIRRLFIELVTTGIHLTIKGFVILLGHNKELLEINHLVLLYLNGIQQLYLLIIRQLEILYK